MHTESDQDLIRRYVAEGADDAFKELVDRHFGLVWSAARRVTGSSDAALDVAQSVFVDLARKARTLSGQTVIAGWLHRAACHAAAKHVRKESRRSNWEKLAMESNPGRGLVPPHSETDPDPLNLQSVLDAALGELSEADRDAVVLRYLSGRSLAEVGAVLGASEDAAQKRVRRALDRLRESFLRRGVQLSEGVLAASLAAAASQPVPVGLATSVAAGALAGVGASPGALSLILLMKNKLILGTLCTVVVGAALIHQQRELQKLEAANADLRQQVDALRAPPKGATVSAPSSESSELQTELMRLRGELARRRRDGGSDLERRLREAENRAAQAEAEASRIAAEERANAYTVNVINALKHVALAAHVFATSHEGRIPTSFEEIRTELELPEDNRFPGGIGLDLFEFFPHERELKQLEPSLILFREKSARQQPDGVWVRVYAMGDGSVQTLHSKDGDFSDFERAGTGTAANAPAPATAGK
jgi:RNA polymerase sigma factor (sigma-70 family)